MERRQVLLATLRAWVTVQGASFPALNPGLSESLPALHSATEAELDAVIAQRLEETDRSPLGVRVFWKIGTAFAFAGGNRLVAGDAGHLSFASMLGKTDFDPSFPWSAQAAKYRQDDLTIVQAAVPRLDIVERQNTDAGTSWLRTSKAPILLAPGQAIGLLGMYGVIDRDTAVRLLRDQGR